MCAMSFVPTDEQKMLVEAINKYAVNEARKVAHEADETGNLPADVIRKGWEIGVLPASIPEQYGGVGGYKAVTKWLGAAGLALRDLPRTPAGMGAAFGGPPVRLRGSR